MDYNALDFEEDIEHDGKCFTVFMMLDMLQRQLMMAVVYTVYIFNGNIICSFSFMCLYVVLLMESNGLLA